MLQMALVLTNKDKEEVVEMVLRETGARDLKDLVLNKVPNLLQIEAEYFGEKTWHQGDRQSRLKTISPS